MSAAQLPENIRKALLPDGKKDMKMLIAQGAVPLPPQAMIEALRVLSTDPDQEVQEKSKQTVEKMPENILSNFATSLKTSNTLDFIASVHVANEDLIEKILVNTHTPDETYIRVSGLVSEKIATIISNNQVRLLRSPKIAENLRKNPNLLQADQERMTSFLRMNGVVLEGESAELTLSEIENILTLGDEEIPEEFLDDSPVAQGDQEKLSIYQYVQQANTAAKIKLALKGNKEARGLLIKDSNKVVSVAVIKNPKVTDGEVLSFCQNRSINEEILRLICIKPDWVKHYSIQHALANNPKTPFQQALRFAKILNVNDLKKLSKNKNAHPQLQKVAKQLYSQRKR